MALLEATVVVVVVFDIDVVGIAVYVFVVALRFVTGHIIFSCGQ